METPQII